MAERCVNINLPEFKRLSRIYGEKLSRAFVRGYSRNVKGLTDDFYYPTPTEVKKWLTSDKSKIAGNVSRALEIDPLASLNAIKSLLSGVVHTYKDKIYLTSGPVKAPNVVEQEVRDTIYRPNLKIMRELQERFPRIFDIRYTSDPYRKEVFITPLKEGEQGKLFQKKGMSELGKASPKTLSMIKDFINKIGVDIRSMEQIVVNGKKYDVNGIADMMQRLIMVTRGAEAQALPEEAMHFAVEIVKQKNPSLYKKLLREINDYKMKDIVFNDYANDPNYQTKEGKPDIIKLKEEAIAKVLAQTIISYDSDVIEKPELLEKSNTWWKQILEFLKRLFSTSGFDKLSMDIITEEFEGTAEDIKAETDKMFFQISEQTRLFNRLMEISSRISLIGDNYYIDGRKISKRVSNITETWYKKKAKEKELLKGEYKKAVDAMKAEKGTIGHAAMEYAFHILVDENGYLRDIPLDESDYSIKNPNFDWNMYVTLRDNLSERLHSLDNNRKEGRTRFMSEITIYDSSRDLAGTIDLLAIQPNGKVNIYDWKFMNLNVDMYNDVPYYNVEAWNKQMTQYKLIVSNAYGVKEENFGHTRMIPILAKYTEGDAKRGKLPYLSGVKIGNIDVKKIEEDYLLPVPLQAETTGKRKIDDLLTKLNAIHKSMSGKTVTPAEKKTKAEQLNSLYKAIRRLQVKEDIEPLVYQCKLITEQALRTVKKYESNFLGKDVKTFSDKELNVFSEEIKDMKDAINNYIRLDNELESLFSGELTKEEEGLLDDMRKAADKARRVEITLEDTLKDFVADFIVKSENVNDYLAPEKIIKDFFSRWFVTTSGIQLKAVQTLFKKANRAFTRSDFDTVTESRKLASLRDEYEKWTRGKGLSRKNYFDIIKKKDKNELIDEFQRDFYTQLKNKIDEKDYKWIRDNVNIPEYAKFLRETLDKEIEWIKSKPRVLSEQEIENMKDGILPAEMEREITGAKRLYDVTKPDSLGWLLYQEIKNFPKEKWLSAEWKELIKPENKPAKDFYDYIIERNNMYKELGYINNPRTFLPFVKKGLTERLITGSNPKLGEQFLRSISIDEGDVGYGEIDPLIGQPVNAIPKYFTKDPGFELSTDLFRTMALYNEAAIKYKYVRDIEDQMRALLDVEKNKGAIATSSFGKTIRKAGEIQHVKDNNENSKILEDMIKSIIYGQKYIQSDTFDQLLIKLGSWGETLNKKLGMTVFPENLSGRQISMNKAITNFNNFFRLNALGLNILSGTSNFFGGSAQALIGAGTYFNKVDFTKAWTEVLINKFTGRDKKKMIAALEYFLPFTQNYNREIAKKLTVNSLTQESLQDFLMVLMRNSDFAIQTINFYAFLNNSIVIDGKVVNAREYIRSLPEFQNKYAPTAVQRREYEDRFEDKLKQLLDQKGVMKLAKVENGEFIIPGVDRNDESVIELRRKVQQVTKDSLGNLSDDDIRLINLNVYGASFMMFKNWIPRQLDLRLGNLKYNVGSDAYEWGRMRTIARIISDDLIHSLDNLYGALVVNDRGVEYMRQLYEKKAADYKNDTGKDLEMTEDQFIELVHSNVRNQLLDVLMLSGMLLLLVGLKAAMPDDDDHPAVMNQYRFMVRIIDKFTGELSYFWDPSSIMDAVSSGIFPSMSLVKTFRTAVTNFFIENWAIATGNEELEKDTKVIKYWMKSFPFTTQVAAYMPLFYPELAKDLGLRMQSNYGLIKK